MTNHSVGTGNMSLIALRRGVRSWGPRPLLVLLTLSSGCGGGRACGRSPGIHREETSPAASGSATPRPRGCPPRMAFIPARVFEMGADVVVSMLPGATDADNAAAPSHRVRASDVCMDITEVTVAEYAACVAAGHCAPAKTGGQCNAGRIGRDQHPINCVDHLQAEAYCASLGARLPTEIEWESAATPSGGDFPWGGFLGVDLAAASKICIRTAETPRDDTCPVGTFPGGATSSGLLDLAGNVAEWTASRLCRYPSHDCPGEPRWAVRGGAVSSLLEDCTTASRIGELDSERVAYVGFRCAIGMPATTSPSSP